MTASAIAIAVAPVLALIGMLMYFRREGRKIDAAQAERLAARQATTPKDVSFMLLPPEFARSKLRSSGIKAAMKQQERMKLYPEKVHPRANV